MPRLQLSLPLASAAVLIASFASSQSLDGEAMLSSGLSLPTTGVPDRSDARALPRLGGIPRDGFDDVPVTLPVDLPYFEIVDPSRYVPGSLSLGTTSDGSLRNAARLPIDGPAHYVLHGHRERETHYGTEELIGVLLDAAEHLHHAFPDTRLGIGNLSVQDGGDISWSASHNNGRDADVAFAFLDSDGAPSELEGLVPVRRNGRPRDGSALTFDLPRNWAIVEGLLSSDAGQIQWIFVYNPLRERLIEYGRENGADPDLLARADEVLRQPGDSANHNDHFHVRVYCSVQDRIDGCINWGPRREWANYAEPELDARVRELLRGVMDPEPEIALACLDFLERLQPRESAFVIASALPHQSSPVQLGLMELLADLDQRGVTGPIVPLAESSPDNEVREKAFWLLGRLADPASAPALAGVVARDARPLSDGTPAREAAATALRNILDPAIVPVLIDAISDPRPDVRSAVGLVLHRNTGVASPSDPGSALDGDGLAALASFWSDWWAEHGAETRAEWLERAFRRAGYDVGDLDGVADLDALASAVDDTSDAVAFNADRLLNELTGNWTPSEGWTPERRARYWRSHASLER